MPWKSIDDLPNNIKSVLPTGAQKIFLETFNSAWGGSCKDKGDQRETCAIQQAWGAVKKSYTKEGDKWVSSTSTASIHSNPMPFMVAAEGNPLIVSGPLIEIGAKNLNEWGIPEEEVEAVMAGLLGVPLRKCSGAEAIFNEHFCDYRWQPKDEIGKIIAAYKHEGWIHATAKITDKIARSKVGEGTWTKKWSIFGAYKTEDINQMRHGTIPLSVTLVNVPAYPGAGFKQAASKSSQKETDESSKENGNMSGEDEKLYTQEDLEAKLKEAAEADHATMVQQQEELSKGFDETMVTEKTGFAAALEDKDKQIKDLQSASDKHKTEQDDMVPRTEVESMLEASAKAVEDSTIQHFQKKDLSAKIATLQASTGVIQEDEIEQTKTSLMEKSPAALEQDLTMFEKMSAAFDAKGEEAVDAFKELNLQTQSGSAGPALDWDPIKKEWS